MRESTTDQCPNRYRFFGDGGNFPAGAGHEAKPEGDASSPLRTLTVLVVEDNQVNQLVATGILKKLGHRVDVASNGTEALQLWRRGGYDLIFMDLQMPIMDGFQTVATIRSEEQETGEHVPIVALTAHTLDADRKRCADVGMDGFITKPINRAEFMQAIQLARRENDEKV